MSYKECAQDAVPNVTLRLRCTASCPHQCAVFRWLFRSCQHPLRYVDQCFPADLRMIRPRWRQGLDLQCNTLHISHSPLVFRLLSSSGCAKVRHGHSGQRTAATAAAACWAAISRVRRMPLLASTMACAAVTSPGLLNRLAMSGKSAYV